MKFKKPEMKNYFKIIILCGIIVTSSNNSQKKRSIPIIGNWYIFDKARINEIGMKDINYQELYFSDQRIFTYMEIAGQIRPVPYKISNDSIFTSIKNDNIFKYVGTIDSVANSFFRIKIGDTTKYFYKIPGNITLERVILKEIPEKTFEKNFFERRDLQYSKSSITNN